MKSKPDSARLYAEKGLTLARKIKYDKGEANCIRKLGVIMGETGNYPKSLELLLKALKICERNNDIREIALCNVDIEIIMMSRET